MEHMDPKNILFVDDDENVLSGIQRQLRPYREQWRLFFAINASSALVLMSKQPIDLIVSDIMMPEMQGDELLRIVSENYPATVRMILSGHADEENLKNGMKVAHQYLSKPCSAEMLREVITQVFKIQSCVSNLNLVASVGDPNQLPSLPKIYQELNAAIADENTTVRDIADIFARDMVLSAKLLQLINSPYFGLNRTISSLSEAINLIGIRKLNSLVLSVHIKMAFSINNPVLERYMESLWQDAVRVAELARHIAVSENQQQDRPDQAYLGGLLHNMGLLIFMSRNSEGMTTLLQQLDSSDMTLPDLEKAIFGFARSEAAAYVLSLWKIPPRIIEAVLLQYTPNETQYDSMNALTSVHVAACLLKPAVMENNDRLLDMNLDLVYLQRIGKLDRLPEWQKLADKILNQYPRE